MPVLRTVKTSSGWSQDKQRAVALFHDQHRSEQYPDGRPWWGVTERAAIQDGDTPTAALPGVVGDLNVDGWEAPWYPEQKYFNYAPSGRMLEFRLRIEYGRMRTDYTAATRAYYERAVKKAAALKMSLPTYNSVIPWELQQVVGPAPKSPKIPEAALAGDRWLLFGEGEENEVLHRLLTMGTEWVPTPEQSVKTGDEMQKLRGELEELKAMLTEQRTKKEKQSAAMAHARASRGKTAGAEA
jgi:hypothetical protein